MKIVDITEAPVWKRNPDGSQTSYDTATGNTTTKDSRGIVTTNAAGQKVSHTSPRFMGVQSASKFDPSTGKEINKSTNFNGKVAGTNIKANIKPNGAVDPTNMSVTNGDITVSNTPTGSSASIRGANGNTALMTKQGTTLTQPIPVAPVAAKAPVTPVVAKAPVAPVATAPPVKAPVKAPVKPGAMGV